MTKRITIRRSVSLPDPLRLERRLRAPDLGPKILFFSGGTALRELSQELVRYTHNSIHVITPFDSGGSSAVLRRAFNMLAVGDLRNRLMALADRSIMGNPQIFRLFAYRFPKEADPNELRIRLNELIKGEDELIRDAPEPMRRLIRSHLYFFSQQMTRDFNLRGASIGNLILAGGYFNYNRHIDPVIFLFSKLVEARGVVRPVLSQDLHLAAELEDGSNLIGQHLITGKEVPPLESPVKRVFLSASPDRPEPVQPEIPEKMSGLIRSADLICYPMGSFYTSLIANLLPLGVGTAAAECGSPKVYIPNSSPDPEQTGLTLTDCTARLIEYLKRSCHKPPPTDRLLNLVLVDSKNGQYPGGVNPKEIERLGVEVADLDLCGPSAPLIDPEKLISALLSLA